MKINWKVRFNRKNITFLCQIAISIIVPVLTYFGLEAKDMTTWSAVGRTILAAISNPYVVVMVLVSAFNAITDPTTKGISDSENALAYEVPKED